MEGGRDHDGAWPASDNSPPVDSCFKKANPASTTGLRRTAGLPGLAPNAEHGHCVSRMNEAA